MNVGELIERLQRENPEAEVLGSDCCYGLSTITVIGRDAVIAPKGGGYTEGARTSVEHIIDHWDGEWYVEAPGPIVEAVILK